MKTITKSQYDALHPYLPAQRGNVFMSNLTLTNAALFFLLWKMAVNGGLCRLSLAIGTQFTSAFAAG